MRKLFASLAVVLVAGALSAVPAGAGDTGPLRLGARMTGDRVFPLPGDPDGRGRAQMKANLSENLFCFQLELIGLSEVTEGHIHMGQAGEIGDVVINLHLEENGQDGCVPAGRATLRRIMENPQAFYIDVHTTEHPLGAIRDQLSQRS